MEQPAGGPPGPPPKGAEGAPAADPGWQPGMPSIREHLPSLIWGAALPIGIYFLARSHVHTDAQALIVAGSFSVAWIVVQFIRQRRVDFVGAIVLSGFAVGVISSTLLGGNAYVLKVRDAAFTAIFGIVCVVTLYTHDRPVFFYLSRYLSAGRDPYKVSAFDRLHEHPSGRHTFRVLSVVWGVGLFVEASLRMLLADILPTSRFLAVSPFVTGGIIGSLLAFTAVYTKRAQLQAALSPDLAPAAEPDTAVATASAAAPEGNGMPQIPFP